MRTQWLSFWTIIKCISIDVQVDVIEMRDILNESICVVKSTFCCSDLSNELFMNWLLKKKNRRRCRCQKETFSKSKIMNKKWVKKVKYNCSHNCWQRPCLGSYVPVNEGIYFCTYTSKPEWIYHIYSYYFKKNFIL